MTILKDIFAKKVDRSIEGVIKADDDASLGIELEEYVLTNEVQNRLRAFLSAYNDYNGANGVWISGFFGSGKSHLLKMLALLLENRQVQLDGGTQSALDLFLPKCPENELVSGEDKETLKQKLKKAVSIPSKSILFNIDQKADVISKTQVDALLAVFVKVFDEMCGYYGKQGHIAQFERDLDSRYLYEDFKHAYRENSGKEWSKGREQAILESSNIAKAYSQVTHESEDVAKGILEKYRAQYHLSIEDFAKQVNEYIERQIKLNDLADFRLNFFVDEVGQYIAENVKLMTNLQTVAESLATKCKGRAWVIVTAQEDMDSVVGERGGQQSNDFSKIQARFANRMKLTSQDVAEVIQKRLLIKNKAGEEILSTVYHEQKNNFKTLFDFASDNRAYQNFKSEEHFVNSYPFIPYQFTLFQAAISNLSKHNAFEGQHSSVGERSMLGVFQQVIMKISDNQVGELATFDLMFEGIRTALKSDIQSAILTAESNLDSTFAISVLKALFLVKYIKEFKPTVHNICVLMLNSFDKDIGQLKNEIDQALNLLESQTYIRRTGEVYEYLTNEEKDIEEEIKSTDVDTATVADHLQQIIFNTVIKNRKIRYDANGLGNQGQDYSFSNKLDDKLYGREFELSINVISPFYEHSESHSELVSKSALHPDELLVAMPSDARLIHELIMYKRTEKYISHNNTTAKPLSVSRILQDKGLQNRERLNELETRIEALIVDATLLVAGNEIAANASDAQSRINKGFNELITQAYPNLQMLKGVSYKESDVRDVLQGVQQGSLDEDVNRLSEPEGDIFGYITRNKRNGLRTTGKSLVEYYEKKPYGWSQVATLYTLARLCVRNKVEVQLDGHLLESDKLADSLLNARSRENMVLEPQLDFTPSQIRQLKEFYQEFFDSPPSNTEAKALAVETIESLKEKIIKTESLFKAINSYPFLRELEPAIKQLKALTKQPYSWFLTQLDEDIEDELFNVKEHTLDPIFGFMNGTQKKIYDDAKAYLNRHESNLKYIDSAEANVLSRTLDDVAIFKGNKIQQAKALLDTLKDQVQSACEQARKDAVDAIDLMQSRMQKTKEYAKLPEVRQAEFDAPFVKAMHSIKEAYLIAVIKDSPNYFEEHTYSALLQKMVALVTPRTISIENTVKSTSEPDNKSGQPNVTVKASDSTTDKREVKEPVVKYIAANKLKVPYESAWLESEEDVQQYVEAMRQVMLEQIRKGKRVQI